MAAVRCCARIAAVWFLRAAMAERSAPTIPRWCFTVRRERFLATSSVIPFLCMRRYTWVQAILRGFLRCKKSDSFLEVAKRKIFGAWGEEMEGKGTGRRHGPCCPPARKGGPCWGRYGSRRMSRFRASTLRKVPLALNVRQRTYGTYHLRRESRAKEQSQRASKPARPVEPSSAIRYLILPSILPKCRNWLNMPINMLPDPSSIQPHGPQAFQRPNKRTHLEFEAAGSVSLALCSDSLPDWACHTVQMMTSKATWAASGAQRTVSRA